MRIEEIGSYGLNYIKSKARELVVKYGFPWSEFENLQQDMVLDLIQRLPDYDPAKSPRNAFVTLVVKHKSRSLIQQRNSPSREVLRREVSANQPLDREGRQVERIDTFEASTAEPSRAAGLLVDVQEAVAAMPPELRDLWNLRVQNVSFMEISRRLNTHRPTLYDHWEKVIQHLRTRGIDDYFENR